jgi:tetratricopeptide (TPR) repeat protein
MNEMALEMALSRFREAVAISPDFAEAHHAAGLALREMGRNEEAIAAFQRAIDIKHDDSRALADQGFAYMALNRLDDASDSFALALAFDPKCAAGHLGLGILCHRQFRVRDAIEHLEHAVDLDPQSPVPLVHLSAVKQELNRLDDALACLEKAAVLAPNVAELKCNLGILCLKLGRAEEAEIHLRKALALKPDFPEAHFNLGNALSRRDRLDEAIDCYRRAIALRPGYVEAHRNLGYVYRLCGQLDNALASSRAALSLDPECAEAQLDVGAALYYQGRPWEAIACYRRALELEPDYPEAQLNLGLAYLAAGDFERGWAGFEWRFRQTDPDNRVFRREFPWPVWNGEDLAGKSILVWGEQGISDELMFASLFDEIIRAAGKCVIECAPKLVPLLARSFPAADVVPRNEPPHPATRARFDYQTAAGSAARWLRPARESFPRRAGYLVADEKRVEYWRRRLEELGSGLKVGFSWRSRDLKGVRALFSTRIEHWRVLFQVQGVHWICLQYDECDAELEFARREFGVKIHRPGEVDYFDDLDEVSALMKSLDLVISAPTVISVQAAALGMEVWQLNFGLDWQVHGTGRNLWFPTLVRYERRPDQTWPELLAGIARELSRRARERA